MQFRQRTVVLLLATLAVALGFAPRTGAAPPRSISRYVSNPDPARWFDLGCALGTAVFEGTRPPDAGVILDFGDPARTEAGYGALIFSGRFLSLAGIRRVAQEYGNGYWSCSPVDSTLRVVVGTTNHGSHVSFGHGAAWANLVDSINGYYRANCCIAAQVAAVGGLDSELDWNPPSVTRAWVDGYDSANDWLYLNFGDAAGCPPAGSCNGGWDYEDIWYVSWGNPAAWPMPEVYNELGTQAAQWERINVWAVETQEVRMDFRGSLAQHQACLDLGSACPGVDNTADEAWSQLYRALNSHSSTAQPLRWSSDISWRN
jgi:hypothetical protein